MAGVEQNIWRVREREEGRMSLGGNRKPPGLERAERRYDGGMKRIIKRLAEGERQEAAD